MKTFEELRIEIYASNTDIISHSKLDGLAAKIYAKQWVHEAVSRTLYCVSDQDGLNMIDKLENIILTEIDKQ